jgi:hypothetical protein
MLVYWVSARFRPAKRSLNVPSITMACRSECVKTNVRAFEISKISRCLLIVKVSLQEFVVMATSGSRDVKQSNDPFKKDMFEVIDTMIGR